MGQLEKIRRALKEPIDTFHCYHCGKKYPGKWCPVCTDKNPRGTYYDERGYPCKTTGVLPPNTERVKRMDFRMNFNNSVKVKLTGFGTDVLRQRHAEFDRYLREEKGLQGLGPFTVSVDDEGYTEYQIWDLMQTFGIYMAPAAPEPFESEMIFLKGEPIKKDSSAGNLTVNVNMVSNIKDFSKEFTREFEKVIEQIESKLSRPLSDYVSVEISTGDGS